ncbi:hypothetical protein KW789_02555 [Candidatus Saccharibacteria bacterium]|jgi:hypothetical protein|nr:hypothetical protein [Candidatus Saccharibacteria bacterium]
MEQVNNLHLNYTVPVVANDGHTIFIAEQGPVTLVFFQTRGQSTDHIDADVVAAVRMHSIEELEQFKKAIDNTIKQHKNREP